MKQNLKKLRTVRKTENQNHLKSNWELNTENIICLPTNNSYILVLK